ncbi:MAG: CPBP family intramembrane metalloprotease [Lachnospiraceae bacterium]|nr:CPBP family intramembrane metalloprotease [Lachnospiraceae bacterium]
MNGQNSQKSQFRSNVETAVIVFVLGYGLHYIGYFIRARYFKLLEGLAVDEGIAHVLMYLGHVIFLAFLLLYALAVRKDRKYILSFARGGFGRNIRYALAGAVTGFVLMGICVLSAASNGNLEIRPATAVSIPFFVFAALAVFIQATVEEIESRAFVFGKTNDEGVPLVLAIVTSAFFFSYIHAANPGFGWLPLTSIFVLGVLLALCYYYFGTIWFCCTAHMMWNFTQDFVFGLPDSGKPAVVSLFKSTANGSSFFYDETFGIEGSYMAIVVNILACVVVVVIGRYIRKRRNAEDTRSQNKLY